MATSTTPSRVGEYVVRLYDPGDGEGVRSLYETVFGKSRSPEWLSWRYDTPYVDGPQVVVATRAGTVVGAEPFITFRFETGTGTELAVQPADAMVHPDHRRQGLLTAMTEYALEYYTDRKPAFVFNFPNRQAVDAFRKLGWREVPDVTVDYRIHSPDRFIDVDAPPTVQRTLGTTIRSASDALYALLDRLDDDDTVAVERHDGVSATTLESLYRRDVPDALHAKRDAAFFAWRFANPEWSPITYVASRQGVPVAAMIAVTETANDYRFTKVMEALPMGGAGVESAMARLLAAVCRDHAESDVVKMAHPTVPRSVSRRLGFLRGDLPPLAGRTTPSTMVVRPLDPDGAAWTVGDRTLTDRDEWAITYSEQDTAY